MADHFGIRDFSARQVLKLNPHKKCTEKADNRTWTH